MECSEVLAFVECSIVKGKTGMRLVFRENGLTLLEHSQRCGIMCSEAVSELECEPSGYWDYTDQ